jgi:hypothetical protein
MNKTSKLIPQSVAPIELARFRRNRDRSREIVLDIALGRQATNTRPMRPKLNTQRPSANPFFYAINIEGKPKSINPKTWHGA